MILKLILAVIIVSCAGATNVATAGLIQSPVPQLIGHPDVHFNSLKEGRCRTCHGPAGGPNTVKHHVKVGQPVPAPTAVPYKPTSDGRYTCTTCHLRSGRYYVIIRSCPNCHIKRDEYSALPHHNKVMAKEECINCHTILGNNPDGASTVPPENVGVSLVGQVKERSCDSCHNIGVDPASGLSVLSNSQNHHLTGHTVVKNCTWCHDMSQPNYQFKACLNCHSKDSVHGNPEHYDPADQQSCFICHAPLP